MDEGLALSTQSFWDDRYATSNSDQPTHEWFRTFDSLQPFFVKQFYSVKPAEENPRVLHLGCGDSVSFRNYTQDSRS
jgi:EEF1A lysine methyltransferase 4